MATLSLRGAIWEQHPEWPREERLWLEEQLKALGVTSKQYQKDPWKMDNKVWDAVGTWEEYQSGNHVAVADPFKAPASGFYINPLSDAGLQNAMNQAAGVAAGTVGLNSRTSAKPQTDGSQQTGDGMVWYGWVDSSGRWVQGLTFTDAEGNTWMMPDPSGLGGEPIQVGMGPQQRYGEVQYGPNGEMYQIGPDGQYISLGMAPSGVSEPAPASWAGWGQDWEQYTEFDPTTKTMVTKWRRKPMGYEAALAQGQWANLPENWYNVALMERQLSPEEVKYDWSVPAVVGRMVGGQGAYDLQAWQSAMGITPTGWNANWQAGYGTSTPSGSRIPGTTVGGLPTDPNGPLPTDPNGPTNPTNPTSGGYVTYVPSMQDFGSWAPSERQQMYGWLGSGLSGWRTADDYWNEMQKLSAPSGSGRSLYYR
jgi:hypothetical protein